jgi:histidine triad (HIT) family protein
VSSCLFCRIVAGEVPSKQAFADDGVFAFHDVAPQAPVHVLVVPRVHVRTLAELEPDGDGPASVAGFMRGVRRAADALGLDETGGYRLVVNCGERASQSVFHVHAHLLSGRPFGWPPG